MKGTEVEKGKKEEKMMRAIADKFGAMEFQKRNLEFLFFFFINIIIIIKQYFSFDFER